MSVKTKLFARDATGLVREAGSLDAIIFNIAVCGGLGFVLTWGLTWALYATPGTNLVLAIFLSMLLSVPTTITFALLSATIPRSGGDYVFVSRIVHPALGLASNLGMWLSNIMCTGLIPYFVCVLALAPSFAILGNLSGATWATNIASALGQPHTIMIVGTLFIVLAGALMLIGIRRLLVVENVSFLIAAVGLVLSAVVLAFTGHSSFASNFNAWAQQYTGQADSYNSLIQTAKDAGLGLSGGGFSGWSTFGSLAIGYGILNWTWWSSYIGGELKGATSRRRQILLMLGGLIILAAILMLMFALVFKTIGYDFFSSMQYLYNLAPDKYPLPVPPYLNLFVSLVPNSALLTILLSVTFLGWAIPYMMPVSVMLTRCLFAWSFDGILPRWVANVDDRTHAPIPAILIVSVLSIAFLAWIVYGANFFTYLAALTFVTVVSMTAVGIAGIVMPYKKKELFQNSPADVKIAGIPLLAISGALMLLVQVLIVALYILFPALGFASVWQPIAWALGVVVVGGGAYYIAKAIRKRQGVDLKYVFTEIPPE